MTLEYELVDADRVCPGVHKVGVGPATRSAVATSYTPGCKKIVPRNNIIVQCNVNKETSQLAGNTYEDSDYTILIAVVH